MISSNASSTIEKEQSVIGSQGNNSCTFLLHTRRSEDLKNHFEVGQNLYDCIWRGDLAAAHAHFPLPKVVDVNAAVYGRERETLLHAACILGRHLPIVERLLDAGAGIRRDRRNATPLHIAAKQGYVDTVRMLLDRIPDGASYLLLRANLRKRFFGERREETALTCAAGNGHLDVVRCLLKAEADAFYGGHAKLSTPEGWTQLHDCHPAWMPPAHVACYEAQPEILRYFVEELGISVDSRTLSGKQVIFSQYPRLEYVSEVTLLQCVLINQDRQNVRDHLQCVKYLLDQEADITLRAFFNDDTIPKSALDVAWQSDFTALALMAWKKSFGRLSRPKAFRIGQVRTRMQVMKTDNSEGHDVSFQSCQVVNLSSFMYLY